MVPSRIAMKVAPSTSALPAGSSCFFRWSGRMPYLIGPNSVAITPNRNSVANMIGIEWNQKPTTPSPATAISASLTKRATIDLSKRSAICPPRPARKKNGPMNTAAVSVISASRLVTPGANRIRNTSAFLRKLSLNAEKNWHQNSGAKRRDVIRELDIGDSSRDAKLAVLERKIVISSDRHPGLAPRSGAQRAPVRELFLGAKRRAADPCHDGLEYRRHRCYEHRSRIES